MRAGSRGRERGERGEYVDKRRREKQSEGERARQRTKRVTVTSRCIGSLCSTHFREHSFATLPFFLGVGLFVSCTRPLDGSLETVLFPGNIPSFLATEARNASTSRDSSAP